MIWAVAAGFGLVVVAMVLWLPGRARQDRAAADVAPRQPFQAVSIRPHGRACDKVRAIAGRRFLVAHAPAIPLKGCDTAECACRYEHHVDRRSGESERRLPDAMLSSQICESSQGSNRRSRRGGRRRTDMMPAQVF